MTARGEGTTGVPWGSLFRKAVLTDYVMTLPRELNMCEDYILWLRLLFKRSKPVSIVHEKVYEKGPDTTSSTFDWTADYALFIDNHRRAAIPSELHEEYISDMVTDALDNHISVASQKEDREWRGGELHKRLFFRHQNLWNKGENRRPRIFELAHTQA